MTNWLILIFGLIAIGVFWHFISPADRKKESHSVSVIFLILGIVVYFLESTFIPL